MVDDLHAWETELVGGVSSWEVLIFVAGLIGVLGLPLWLWMAS